jgi:hypothetical protein
VEIPFPIRTVYFRNHNGTDQAAVNRGKAHTS